MISVSSIYSLAIYTLLDASGTIPDVTCMEMVDAFEGLH